MDQIPLFSSELERESQISRKMLQRVPDGKLDWSPHPRSMTLRRLAVHVAEIPALIPLTLFYSGLDFSQGTYPREKISDQAGLMVFFEKSLKTGTEALQNAREEQLSEIWTLRDAAVVYYSASKGEVLRMWFSQIIHHRAQLGVFLRLLDIPIPGSYGPSADEPN